MCGIWASLGIDADRAVIDSIAHRGPDGAGWQQFDTALGPLILAHRRLAIIDTRQVGAQPMISADGNHVIVYNGEAYNYQELRAELAAEGESFRTATDTEVILAAYRRWGAACLDRLNGMFALVIFDRQKQKLFLARDRFGVKPLYVHRTGRGIAFASEIKQFAQLRGFRARMNRQRVYDFLISGLTDHTGETLFAGVEQLLGGECAEIDLQVADLRLIRRRWYDLPRNHGPRLDDEAAAKQFRTLLEDSVRYRLISDVPVGSCLSGGLDSSAIVCLMAQQRGAETVQKTFTAVYAEKEADESRFAKAVAQKAGVEAHYLSPEPDELIARWRDLVWHQDEPFTSTSPFAQWEVFRRAREEGVTVMLDGQGADEQLGGYHYMYAAFHAGLFRRGRWLRLWKELRGHRAFLGVAWRAQLRGLAVQLAPEPLLRLLAARRGGQSAPDWLRAEGWRGVTLYRSPVADAVARRGLPQPRSLGDLCRAQVASINLPMLLHFEDRSSMAHSVEARVPFLDYRLVEFSLRLSDDQKIAKGETKAILRRAMRGILPDIVAERRDKLGFPTPEQRWLRGPLADILRQRVQITLERFPSLFNSATLQRHVEDVIAGRRPYDTVAWRVACLGVWAETFDVAEEC